ncbi:LEAF RUST 10 DISEASE-RESISTANCE LOCUS RECEPTOR-LIKE PROTEIN KINASE-like 2.1 [Tasmannia lanceolata]|uniref:LEAF RUST 10 DISEASE-RESISTANCE LOCUS RECEPTOR-LIKE PROTEIN KINASE-like 2.1 n=1 Tax=Tasmannia lanceolata TaxID=3420 RepID=UPI004064A06F
MAEHPQPLLLLLFLFLLPTSTFGDDVVCDNSFSCGNGVNISYPFWHMNGSTPYCGYPNLGIYCDGPRPALRLSNKEYYVEEINYKNRTITLVDPEVVKSTCPRVLQSVKLETLPTLFYSGLERNLTFFFNCTSLNVSAAYVVVEGDIPLNKNSSWQCKEKVVVPVMEKALNGFKRNLTGFGNLSTVLREGFRLNWTSSPLCAKCEASSGHCTYTDGLGDTVCVRQGKADIKIITGVITGVGSILLACLVICLFCMKYPAYNLILFCKKRKNNTQDVEAYIRGYGLLGPQRYSYSYIKKITSSFRDKVGQGGYGSVFKGKLRDGRLVAVKVLSESKGNGEEFINEVSSISRTSHINVVSLLGFCAKGLKRALIYEFMPNGSLEKFIYSEKPRKEDPLGWEKLYQITVGIARGLEYLHRGCNTRILHLDIKPHNILLDQDFCPKISDFGLAKLCPTKESTVSLLGARGTFGYTAPEIGCRNIGGVSPKSDVYSYGMMVLEMVGGRKNIDTGVENTSEIYFPHWIYKRMDLNGDLGLDGVTAEEEKIARKMILVGLWCIQTNPKNRPSMNIVVEMLEGSLENIQMPPNPSLLSPARSSQEISTVSMIIRDGSP